MAKSRLVSVKFALTSPYAALSYAFKTTIKESESTALGHTALDGSSVVTGLIYRANAPKPAKATKTLTGGQTSTSFIDRSAFTTAAASGWQIIPSKRSGGRRRKTRRTTVVYVTINSVKYAWNIRDTLYAKLKSSLDALGVKPATTDDACVFGASFPKPPKVKFFTTQGTEEINASTFIDPDKQDDLSALFEVIAGKVTAADWAAIAT